MEAAMATDHLHRNYTVRYRRNPLIVRHTARAKYTFIGILALMARYFALTPIGVAVALYLLMYA
jgi:hypothetical protein